MNFKEQIRTLSNSVAEIKDQSYTIEMAREAFIMPFIDILGYDVLPEDDHLPGNAHKDSFGYALMQHGEARMLIQFTTPDMPLQEPNKQNLSHYFHASDARFAILTNGIEYRFYTDLSEKNRMDADPFFHFNMSCITDHEAKELCRFHRGYYNADQILDDARESRYENELKVLIEDEFSNPTPQFVKHFAKHVYPSIITAKVLERFTSLTKKTLKHYIQEQAGDQGTVALTEEGRNVDLKAAETKMISTPQELEDYMIAKTFLRQKVRLSKISYCDAQSYFAVLEDDNNSKAICRLHFGA